MFSFPGTVAGYSSLAAFITSRDPADTGLFGSTTGAGSSNLITGSFTFIPKNFSSFKTYNFTDKTIYVPYPLFGLTLFSVTGVGKLKARLHGSPRLISTVESTKVNRVNSSFQRK
jgi:hypothetical protein